MKPKSTLRAFLALAGTTLLTITYASATTYYWDGNNGAAGFQNSSPGPAGTWSGTTTTSSSAPYGFTTDSTGSTTIYTPAVDLDPEITTSVTTTGADTVYIGKPYVITDPGPPVVYDPLQQFTGVITIDGTVDVGYLHVGVDNPKMLGINTPTINFPATGTIECAVVNTQTPLPDGVAITGAASGLEWKNENNSNLNITNIGTNGAGSNILTGPGRLVVNNTLQLGAKADLMADPPFAGTPFVFNGGVLRMNSGILWTSFTTMNADHPLTFTPNKDVSIDRRTANPFTVDNVLNIGTGGLIIEGTTTADVILNLNYQYSGPTRLAGGIASVEFTEHLGLPASNLVFDGGALKIRGTTLTNFSTIGHTVVFTSGKVVALNIDDAGHTFTVDQALNQGTGGFAKTGAGTVVVNHATSTYTGATSVTAGTLLASNSSLSGATTVSGGTMAISGTNTFSGLITVSSAGTLTLSGDNSAANGGVTMNGATATLNLNSATALGTGTCTLQAGTLKNTINTISTTHPVNLAGNFTWDGVNNLAFGNGDITMAAGRAITLNGTGSILTFGGVLTNTQAGNPILTATGAGNTLVIGGGFALSGPTDTLNRTVTISGTGNVTINGPVTAGGNGTVTASLLTKTGTGTLTLNGDNTYDGLTTHSTAGSTLTLAGDNSGAAGGLTMNNATAVLNINSNTALGTGTFALTTGIIDNTSGSAKTLTLANPITIGGNFTFSGSNPLNLGTGAITNAGSRTITLNGTGSTLTLGGVMTNGVAGTQTTTVNGAGNTLELGGYVLTGSGATPRTGAFNGTGNVTITGAVTNGTATASLLTYSGTGTLTLKGTNTYDGNTTVSSTGCLALVGGSQDSAITVNSGAFLGFTLGQPTTSTKAVTLSAGHKVRITGTPTAGVSYTLLTTTATIDGVAPDIETPLGTHTLEVQGTNTLVLKANIVSNPFDDWALLKGLDGTVGKENGKTDDPDGDGKNNNFEFAFNGDPLDGSDNGLIAGLVQDTSIPADTNELTLVVAVRDGAIFSNAGSPVLQTATKDGVIYTIEGTLDLVTIPGSDVSHAAGPSDTATAAGLPNLTGTDWEYHTFKLDASEGLGNKGFLRAKAE